MVRARRGCALPSGNPGATTDLRAGSAASASIGGRAGSTTISGDRVGGGEEAHCANTRPQDRRRARVLRIIGAVIHQPVLRLLVGVHEPVRRNVSREAWHHGQNSVESAAMVAGIAEKRAHVVLPASQANFPMRYGRCSTGSGRVKVWRPRLRPSRGWANSATAAVGSAQSSTTTSAGLPTAIP